MKKTTVTVEFLGALKTLNTLKVTLTPEGEFQLTEHDVLRIGQNALETFRNKAYPIRLKEFNDNGQIISWCHEGVYYQYQRGEATITVPDSSWDC